jgi:hypothetical protein
MTYVLTVVLSILVTGAPAPLVKTMAISYSGANAQANCLADLQYWGRIADSHTTSVPGTGQCLPGIAAASNQ